MSAELSLLKYCDDTSCPDADIIGLSFLPRSSTVNYSQIKQDCDKHVTKGLASALGVRFNMNGLRIKDGEVLTLGGENFNIKDYVTIIQTKQIEAGDAMGTPGGTSVGKFSDKRLVSNLRISRAYAAQTSKFISTGAVKLPDDLKILANGTGLPDKYAFLAAPYGMNDDELKTHAASFRKFAENFTKAVSIAYSTGGLVSATGKKRDHAAEFDGYYRWRGIDLG
jgi:hypothetical protein